MLETLGIHLHVFEHFTVHAGQQLQQILERPQLLHLPHRRQKILEVHSFLADLLLELLCLDGIK